MIILRYQGVSLAGSPYLIYHYIIMGYKRLFFLCTCSSDEDCNWKIFLGISFNNFTKFIPNDEVSKSETSKSKCRKSEFLDEIG